MIVNSTFYVDSDKQNLIILIMFNFSNIIHLMNFYCSDVLTKYFIIAILLS